MTLTCVCDDAMRNHPFGSEEYRAAHRLKSELRREGDEVVATLLENYGVTC